MISNRATGVFIACSALALWGCSRSTDRWITQLTDADPKVRRAAVVALDKQGDESDMVVAALSRATEDSDTTVRELSVSALGKMKGAAGKSLPALEHALSDSEVSVRVAAALAIHDLDPKRDSYRRVLINSLQAGNGPVFLAVGQMGKEAAWAVPTLVKLSSYPQAAIRALSARTLGEIGVFTDKAQFALQRLAHDENAAVRNAARHVLDSMPSTDGER
jgi:HEAT repeat protein